jgi:hypothetical protein
MLLIGLDIIPVGSIPTNNYKKEQKMLVKMFLKYLSF